MWSSALLLMLGIFPVLVPVTTGSWHQCSAQGTFGGAYGYQAVANLTSFRSRLLESIWSFTTDPAKEASGWDRYVPFNPFISCPPNQPLRRVGSNADGGKIICDVSRLQAPCIIYSLGSAGDYSFEEEMLRTTQCEIHTFDCTIDGHSVGERHHFHKTCLGTPTKPDFKEYSTVTYELGHPVVDFLKMDIEGWEPTVIQSMVSNKAQLPRQITIEMHMRNAVGAIAPQNTAEMALLFYHMANIGYGIVSREDNIWGVQGCCAEFTFLHVEQAHRFRLFHGPSHFTAPGVLLNASHSPSAPLPAVAVSSPDEAQSPAPSPSPDLSAGGAPAGGGGTGSAAGLVAEASGVAGARRRRLMTGIHGGYRWMAIGTWEPRR